PASKPILLAIHLSGEQKPVFRGTELENRLPRAVGSVISMEGDEASIDLGSLDGLGKGTELELAGGRVIVTAVCRERARGRIEGKVRAHDQVRIPVAAYVEAVLERASIEYEAGDRQKAEQLYESARETGQSAIASNNLGVFAELRGDRAKAEA